MHGILGGRWKRHHASRIAAHGESRGVATGRYRGRASALPDRDTKRAGEPGAGNPHAGFKVAGAGTRLVRAAVGVCKPLSEMARAERPLLEPEYCASPRPYHVPVKFLTKPDEFGTVGETPYLAMRRAGRGTSDPRELGSGVNQYPTLRPLISEPREPKAAERRAE